MVKDINRDELNAKLAYICQQFRIPGELILSRWIPNGHINEAYYVAVYDGKEVKQYLIQKVNTYVFRDPISMMHNIELITQHILNKEPTMERRRRLHFHHTASGHNYVRNDIKPVLGSFSIHYMFIWIFLKLEMYYQS